MKTATETTFRDLGVHVSIRDDQDQRLDEGSPLTDIEYRPGEGGIVEQAKRAISDALADYPTAATAEIAIGDDDDSVSIWVDVRDAA